MNAVFWPQTEDRADSDSAGSKYAQYGTLFDDCDIVLIEGDSHTAGSKVEVWRRAIGTAPRALEDRSITAVITDDKTPADLDATQWPRSDVEQLVQNILSMR
jgi:molybdopterin-guanine dinucleotide biosynthesis protein